MTESGTTAYALAFERLLMSLQIRATKHQLADLKRIVDLGSDRLQTVREKLLSISSPPLRPQVLLDAVKEVLPPEDAEALVRQLLSLHGIMRQSGSRGAQVLSGIGSAIEQQGTDAGIALDDWKRVQESVAALLETGSVRFASMAIELAYDYANLLRWTKVLTDIRPLFNESADAIEGAVVSHTLRLRYDSADGEHDLSIALDKADIEKLADQCKRAIRKATTAKSLMEDKCKVAAIIYGEVSND
jgi:hypothetical protein